MTTLDKLEELIYVGFKETDERFKATDERFKATDERFKETDERFKETDERFKETNKFLKETFKETDVRFKETNERFKEADRTLKETFRETDECFKETDRRFREIQEESDQGFQELHEEVAKVADVLGFFSEKMVTPAMVRVFDEMKTPLLGVVHRLQSLRHHVEYDIVGDNDEYVVVVSVKTRLNVGHVKDFLTRRLPKFKDVFPRYQDMKLLGAVAGMSIEQEVDTYAVRQGLFVLAQSGENVTLLNPPNFSPRVF